MAKVFLLILAAAGCVSSQTYSVQTFAGGTVPQNIPAGFASLGAIYGAAIDQQGNIYLSLGDYDMVARVDASSGMLTRIAGGTRGFSGDGGSAASARLSGPGALAVDAAGNIYIADFNNERVRMVSPAGIITTVAQCAAGGLAVDATGVLYIADFYNSVVSKLAGGVVTTIAGNGNYGYGGDGGAATSAQLAGPMGITLDAAGSLYIAEAYNNRVRRVSGGIITTVAGNGTAGFTGDGKAATAANLRTPADVAVDTAGNLYIADYGNNRVRMVFTGSGVISTAAGSTATAFSGDGGSPTGAGLAGPRRVLVDAAGSLYIADGPRLRRVVKGTIATVAGGAPPVGENGPASAAQLGSPQGLAVDSGGNVYISDAGTGRVLKVSGGILARVAGSAVQGFGGDNGPAANASLSNPSAVALDGSGNVYVADTQNLRVRKIANGTISTVAGGGTTLGDNGQAASALLNGPQGLAVDAAGSLYIGDVTRVRQVALPSGVITTAAGTGSAGYQGDNGPATAAYLADASALTVDPAGSLYIADSLNNRVRKVAGGTISTVAGNGTYGFTTTTAAATSAMLGGPAGLAADSAGNVYITDQYRVLKLANGKLTTIAGASNPQGIAVDAAGNLYVAEPDQHRVRILSPAGTTCTVALTVSFAAGFQAPASGGTLAISTITGASCPWVIENLPDWITIAGDPFGVGRADISLVLAPNRDGPRSATITFGGQSLGVTVVQAGVITITGQVTAGTGGLAGVTVALGGAQSATTTTDSGGNYAFPGLDSAGTYSVTPSLAGYSFAPTATTFANSTSNPTGNFTAWVPPQITQLAPTFGGVVQPVPTTFAPGEVVSIYGANLCSAAASATPTLPDRLAACIVTVDGVNIRLYYGSPSQINAVLPQTLAVGAHQLVVQHYTDTGYKTLAAQSAALSFTVESVSIAFVERTENGAAMLLAQYADAGLAGPARPLHAGDTVTLYGTGLGRMAQTFAEGAAPGKASSALATVQVAVEGLAAQVIYAGVQPQYPGLDQITIKLPNYVLAAGKTVVTFQVIASASRTLQYQLSAR